MSIDTQLEKMLRKVEKPARYTGGEVNSVKKDPEQVSVRFGFAFPDTYEIGMSYMGMQILYNILNRNEKIYCERIFAPAEDMEALMREEGRKLFTLETFTPVDELDIVGFTLQYELSYTNVLNIFSCQACRCIVQIVEKNFRSLWQEVRVHIIRSRWRISSIFL